MSAYIPTPEGTRLLQEFVYNLHEEHINAGKPSYRQLAARSEKQRSRDVISFSKTTVSRVLSGKAEPRWDFVVAFLMALGVTDEVITTEWRPRWTTMVRSLHPYEVTVDDKTELPLPGKTCPICGCWVTNQELHDRWHANGAVLAPAPVGRRLRALTGNRRGGGLSLAG